MTERQYVYKIAEVVKVTDGDTYWLRVDVGFRALVLINVRLNGYDCPEAHRGTDWEKDQAAKARYEAHWWLTASGKGDIWIRTEKDPDNFGRWLGEIWYENPSNVTEGLGEYLRGLSLASVWPTKWRDEFEHLDAIPVDTP